MKKTSFNPATLEIIKHSTPVSKGEIRIDRYGEEYFSIVQYKNPNELGEFLGKINIEEVLYDPHEDPWNYFSLKVKNIIGRRKFTICADIIDLFELEDS